MRMWLFFQDPNTGLVTIIAVHNTVLGPGLGGCRYREYESISDALYDVLRLSQAMTHKNALCGINFGGAKSVIIKNPESQKDRKELFKSYGRCVQLLSGTYIAAEDMGTTVQDIEHVREVCPYVAGSEKEQAGGGNPAPYTALGVFEGIKACLVRVLGSEDISGRRFSVQGVGSVGFELCKLLSAQGAKIFVSDIDAAALKKVSAELEVEVVSEEKIITESTDVFVPCAGGSSINAQTVDRLQCSVVAGAANNQVDNVFTERRLAERGILYAPDFVINAGGVILCADELEEGGFSKERVLCRVRNIYATLERVFDIAGEGKKLPADVAIEFAKERVNGASDKNKAEGGV